MNNEYFFFFLKNIFIYTSVGVFFYIEQNYFV